MRYDQVPIKAPELRVPQWIDAQGNETQPLKLADLGSDGDITQLALRALAAAGRSPQVASRVLGLARRSRSAARDALLLNALLASPVPAAQQAALIAEAIPDLALDSPARARAWLERVRPFVTDLPALRVAEAALIAQGMPPGQVFAAAFGAEQPVASNADEDGRAKNRRVEMAPVPRAAK